MRGQIIIGIIAGLASVLLFGSLITGSPAAFMLFYLAAMPLFIAALGWSWPVAGIGAVAGSSALALIGGALTGLVYTVAVAAPAVWLGYLAMLARAPAQTASAGDTPAPAPEQWYPAGKLVVWSAIIGGLLVLPSMLALGLTYEAYHGALTAIARKMLENFQAQGGMELPQGTKLDDMAASIARLAPVATACAWMAATLANLYVAGRIVAISGRLARPWPDLRAIDFPRSTNWAMVAALLCSFVPGMTGVIAGVFAAAFMLAFAILGLAIVHAITLGSPVRILMLGGVYFALIFMGWPVVVLAAIGLGEPLFNLRARARARIGSNRSPPGPPQGGPGQQS